MSPIKRFTAPFLLYANYLLRNFLKLFSWIFALELLCSGSVKFGCSRGRTLNFYTQNYQESLNLKLLSIGLFQKFSKLWSFRIAVLPRGLKLVLGGSHLIYIWTFCPLSCCSSLRIIIYWTIVLSIKCFRTVSRGPTSETAFFEDFDWS